jgi:mono/diheme cytochrome c family protein
MKQIMNRITTVIVLLFVGIAFTAFVQPEKKVEPWDVPAEYKDMENPVAGDQSAINKGKMLYMRNCASCHGRDGSGGGPKARRLKTWEGDFTADYYDKYTDGEQFYKTKFGRDEMPAYKGKISDEDIWAIVTYMKTF